MSSPSRGFRVFVGVLLAAIFVELLIIIGIFSEDPGRDGDIAVVEVVGAIEDAGDVVKELKKFTKNDRVKAIVLRVDSPGGAVGASQEIHDAVVETTKEKKVVASFGNLAASGGYYAAAPAHKIVSLPGTLTGSIGVVLHFFIVEHLLKKAYLKWEVIKSGKVKDIGSPLRPLTDPERKVLQTMSDDVHEQFIEAVAKGRKMPIETVRKIADGRIVLGRQAKELGLVDDIGGLEHAIKVAAKMAGIEEDPKVIYPEEEDFGWLKDFFDAKLSLPDLKVEYRLIP